jgi:hypothetical protein
MYIYTRTHAQHVPLFVRVSSSLRSEGGLPTHTHTHTHKHTHIPIYTYLRVYTCIHTYTHAYTRRTTFCSCIVESTQRRRVANRDKRRHPKVERIRVVVICYKVKRLACVCMYMCMYVWMWVCVCIYMYVCMYVCMYVDVIQRLKEFESS